MKLKSLVIFFILITYSTIFAIENKKVLLLPFDIYSEKESVSFKKGVESMLTKKLDSINGAKVIKHKSKSLKDIEKKQAISIAKKEGAVFVVFGSVSLFDGGFSCDISVVDLSKADESFNISKTGEKRGEVFPFLSEAVKKIENSFFKKNNNVVMQTIQNKKILSLKKSKNLKTEYKRLSAGDVDGDGKKELVLCDGKNIHIFKYVQGELQKAFEIKGKPYYKIVGVSVGDINKNGVEEIFVNLISVYNNIMNSFIIEFKNGDFIKTFKDVNYHYKIITNIKNEKVLYAQKGSANNFFTKGVYKLKWSGKEYIKEYEESLPKGTSVYSFAKGDVLNDKKEGCLFINRNEKIIVLDSNKENIWETENSIGSTEISISERGAQNGDFKEKFYIPHNLYIADIDNDSNSEIIMLNNIEVDSFFGRNRKFKEGFIEIFTWQNKRFVSEWRSKKIKGVLNDYVISDIDNDGINEIVCLLFLRDSNYFSKKSKSYLIFLKAQN